MTYATRQDLVDRFGASEIEALDPGVTGDGDAVTYPKVAAALADASAEVDAALAASYDLPLYEGTYPLLVQVACQIARHRLYDDAEPENVAERAMKARAKLGAIGEGKYRLVSTSGVLVARRTAAKAVGPDPVMTRKALEGF